MKFEQAIKKIRERRTEQYILFFGEEYFLRTLGMQIAIDALCITEPEINISVFEERPDAMFVACAMETLPFASERRAVVIRDTDILTSVCAAEWSKPIANAQMPESNVLIISMQGKPDKRKELVKIIEKNGIMVECSPLSETESIRYIKEMANDVKLDIAQNAAQMLYEFCGGNMITIQNEIRKLSSVSKGNITQKEIEKYVARSSEYNIFKIHDCFCAGNIVAAKKALEELLENDPNPMGLISLLAGNFKQMLVARACKEANYPERKIVASIMEETGAKEWAAKRAIKNCGRFSMNQLRDALKILSKIDFESKQGGVILSNDLYALLVGIYSKYQ